MFRSELLGFTVQKNKNCAKARITFFYSDSNYKKIKDSTEFSLNARKMDPKVNFFYRVKYCT